MSYGCLPILCLLCACTGAASAPDDRFEVTPLDTSAHTAGDTDRGHGSGTDRDESGGLSWPSGSIILDNVTIFDALTHRLDAAVVVAGDELWAVTDVGRDWPDDATVLKLTGHTIIPGLIDAHTHILHSGSTS
ncbi:MAG: hypothetical protein P8R54_33245 [Myxococcota bacterium]|nr:hypothetical protein [Myxococcota bacterium]